MISVSCAPLQYSKVPGFPAWEDELCLFHLTQHKLFLAWQWWALLSRSWSSIDETNFTDLTTELSQGFVLVLGQMNIWYSWSWLFENIPNLQESSLLTRNAAPQNHERPGCSMTRWLTFSNRGHIISIFYMASTCGFNSAVHDEHFPKPYLPCLNIDTEMKYYLRHAVLPWIGPAVFFVIWLGFFCSWLSQLLSRLCVRSPLARWAS